MMIVMEGQDGIGKSTQAKMLCDYFSSIGILSEVVGPHYTEFGKRVHELCKSPDITDTERVLLYTASYTHLLSALEVAEREDNCLFVIDRLFPSALVYNDESENYVQDMIDQVWSSMYLDHDLYFFFLEGIPHREHDSNDFYENKNDPSRLARKYRETRNLLKIWFHNDARIYSISNQGSPEEVMSRILLILREGKSE